MTIHEGVQEKLSDYLDGELSEGEQSEVASHLSTCVACARALEELKQVVVAASAMRDLPPDRDLWAGVARRTVERTGPYSRRVSFTLPELAAASLLVAALSGGAVVFLLEDRPSSAASVLETGPGASSPMPSEGAGAGSAGLWAPDGSTGGAEPIADAGVVPAVGYADAQFDAAVADLERALATGRGRLDPETVSVVEDNLSIIDRAIADARSALGADPSNAYLSGHLVQARRRKLDLLRRAAALTEAN